MKTAFNRVFTLFGIALLTAAMVFLFTACPEEPVENDPEIPVALRETVWTNKSGDKISFTKDSVILTLSGSTKGNTYKLVDTLEAGTTIYLYFNKQSEKDAIIYRDGKVSTVNFDVIKTIPDQTGWSEVNTSIPTDEKGNFIYEDYKYIVENNQITIVKYTGIGGNVVIPNTIDNKPVTKIGRTAFSLFNENNNITNVTIPDTVTYIGEYAFYKNKLTNVTLPSSLIEIGDYAFELNQIKDIIIPNGVVTIGKSILGGYNYIYVYPPSVKYIGYGNIDSPITLGSNVTVIAYGTFNEYYKNKYNSAAGTYEHHYIPSPYINEEINEWIKIN